MLNVLLSLAAVFFATTLVSGAGWYWATRYQALSATSLPSVERQRLVEELISTTPGVFVPTYYEPALGYTLKPRQEITAWNDTFVSNELGYRTGPVEKKAGVFRVIFVGDSWTYGLGVSEEQSFPKQFERVANDLVADPRQIEAWTLALPGYNTLNEVTALQFFFDQIRPDAVVFCPMPNDMNSTHGISPNGHLTSSMAVQDSFTDHLWLLFKRRLFDSHVFRSRWRVAFNAIRRIEQWLHSLDIPFLIHFVATWDAPFVHRFVHDNGIESPYMITPPELTSAHWYNPPPLRHANPAGNRLYGRIAYRAMAEILRWPELPLNEGEIETPLYRSPPPGDWVTASNLLMARRTRRNIPEAYVPGPEAELQCIGVMNCATGAIGRETLVLVRRKPRVKELVISVERLPYAASLYPLELAVSIPSAGGGTQNVTVVPAGGSALHRFSLRIPNDIRPGTAMDVVFRAQRTVTAPDVRLARSLFITAIEQEP